MSRSDTKYHPGDLRCERIPTDEEIDADDQYNFDYSIPRSWKFAEGSAGKIRAWLPHRCDEWVIGDANDVRAMIEDLQEALARMV